MKTRKYQDDCLVELMQTRENGKDKALVVMAPSLGKTVVSAMDVQYFLDENPDTRVLYLCHTNEVLSQAKKTFKKVFGDERSYGLYNGIKKSHHTDFLFASFQTMALHKISFNPDEFSYIIVDEAHHAPANTFKEVVDYFRPKFLLGLTATPNRLDGLDLTEIFGETVYSMDLAEAIANGYVADVDYRLMLDEMQELDSVFVDGEKLSVSELNRRLFVPKRDEEIVRLIKQKASEKPNPKTMIFCRSVEHANNIADLIEGAEVVHSRIDTKECLERIARFRKGQTDTIVSVDQLNEGVDIPQADVIVFLRSTVSPVVFYQQLGRGLRLHDGKDGVLVLDFVGNCERLEMLNDFYNEIKEGQKLFREIAPREEQDKEHFTLNIDTPKFHEELVDILQRISNARFKIYTREEAITALQKKAQELGKTPSGRDIDSDLSMPCCSTYTRFFGSWNKALEVAGLENPRKTFYSEAELIKLLRQETEKLGRIPTQKEIEANKEMPSATTYINRYNTWEEALEAAGLKDDKFSNEELVLIIQKKAKELGRVPAMQDISHPTPSMFAYRFGSWNKALEAAGLDARTSRYTKIELVELLKVYAKENGKVPTRREINLDGKMPSSNTYSRIFGSWNKALEAAGLDAARSKYGKIELAKLLTTYAKENGKVPTKREIDLDGEMPCSATYRKVFGSWNNALRAAGLIS